MKIEQEENARPDTGAHAANASEKRASATRILRVGRAWVRVRFARDALFLALLVAGTALRVVAALGYRPALWFNDSYDYVRIGLSPFPHPLRADGYGLMLWLLKPFHCLALVVAVQHILMLGTAVLGYRLMVGALGVARPWASLAGLPVLLDAYEIDLEHLLLSDTLFTALLFAATAVLVRTEPASWRRAAAVGVLLGAAAVTRTVGVPLIFVAASYLLLRRRPRWAAAAALCAAFALPLGGMALWFHAANGRYELSGADGIYLWGRTAAFADCSKHAPPRHLSRMCPALPPEQRLASSSQIWAAGSPTGWRHGHAFTPETNELASQFAVWALTHQTAAYAKVVAYDLFVRTFSWNRAGYPTRGTEALYHFPAYSSPNASFPVIGGGTADSVARAYEKGPAETHASDPYAVFLRGYQKIFYTRGTILGLIALVGLAGLVRPRNRARATRRPAALLWTTGFGLLAIPPLTVDFDYRYTLPALPFLCMAAAAAWRRPHDAPSPGRLPQGRRALPPSPRHAPHRPRPDRLVKRATSGRSFTPWGSGRVRGRLRRG
ncbi:hypothetical protein [Actinomadura opuntiae]|uniref:hypothetical protein n=1 Tax=Actinomadura sp. OS1-43 TaxID=604315 RepID=UPI00255AA7FB|nr:hypothetical protein [Actinomadura sp. OS1-43]MDL4816158.1 hypothetical protein [Actinomadura sp. OS1-43]